MIVTGARAQLLEQDPPAAETAEDSVTEVAEPELPRFRVEFIVFRNISERSLSDEERWYPEPPPPCDPTLTPSDCDKPALPPHCVAAQLTLEECARLLPMLEADSPAEPPQVAQPEPEPDPEPATGVDEEEEPEEPVEFVTIPAEELELEEVYRRLGNARNYDRIVHQGWIQPGLARDDAVPVTIAASDDGVFVRGDVILSLERFLHLNLDLELEVDGELFILQQGRRLRSGETHYFDHPRFGVIALVLPHEAAELRSSRR